MPDAPHPSTPAAEGHPTDPDLLDQVSAQLDRILQAIMPLHDLLKTQEQADEALTERLTNLMESFWAIADALEKTVGTLATHAFPPAMQDAFDQQERRLQAMETSLLGVQEELTTLRTWLGAPPAP